MYRSRSIGTKTKEEGTNDKTWVAVYRFYGGGLI